MKIIGISGYARSGKDTLGGFLVEDHGYEQVSFAAALKAVLYATNPICQMQEGMGAWHPVAEIVDAHGWDRAKEMSPGEYGIRGLLQRLGTEAGRRILGEDIWVDTIMSTLNLGKKYVFTDMRFPNEYDAVKQAGGNVVRIERPGIEAINPHISETALDGFAFETYVTNGGTLDDLREIARRLA